MSKNVPLLLAGSLVFSATIAGAQTPSSSTGAAQQVPATPPTDASQQPGQSTDPNAQPANPARATNTTATPTTAADLRAGATIYDRAGGVVGKIDSVTETGAVVSTGNTRARIPLSGLGKSQQGLVIGMTKAEFEAAAAQAGEALKR